MPKKIAAVPDLHIETPFQRALGGQFDFINGFDRLGVLAAKLTGAPPSRFATPADSLNEIVHAACSALASSGSRSSHVETDESFTTIESLLSDIVVRVMAASHDHGLRIAPCVASKLASVVGV